MYNNCKEQLIVLFDKRIVLFLLFLVCSIFLFIFTLQANLMAKIPQDFEAYYYAAKAFFAGGNPYSVPEVNRINDTKLVLPFLYHPYFLLLFAPLIKFSIENAARIWLFFNFAAAFYLLWLWHSIYKGGYKAFLLLFLLFFSFNYVLAINFRTGNVALLSAALIWSAFYFLLKENAFGFLIFLFLTFMFKLFPIVFFPLIFFIPAQKRKNLGKLIVGLIAVWLLPFLFRPRLLIQYLNRLVSIPTEGGPISPCSYSLITDVVGRWGLFSTNIIYLIWVGLAIYFLWQGIKKLDWRKDRLTIINLSLLTFIIVVPRFKDYSYVMAVPVVYKMVMGNILLIFLPFMGLINSIRYSNYYLTSYLSFFIALIFWVCLVYNILRKKSEG
ncbi:MAG: glycosyltransferase family 87 protein [Candidatus Margulisiibacteriota bacterium]